MSPSPTSVPTATPTRSPTSVPATRPTPPPTSAPTATPTPSPTVVRLQPHRHHRPRVHLPPRPSVAAERTCRYSHSVIVETSETAVSACRRRPTRAVLPLSPLRRGGPRALPTIGPGATLEWYSTLGPQHGWWTPKAPTLRKITDADPETRGLVANRSIRLLRSTSLPTALAVVYSTCEYTYLRP